MPYTTPDRYPCPFCESASLRLEHVRLFENRHAIAEVSDCERTRQGGSILVWPKQHVERISQLSTQQAMDLVQMIFQASTSVFNAFGPSGMHTFCSAGTLVGQSEAHMHFQIQPRYRDRPYSFAPAKDLPTIPLSVRAAMAAQLRVHADRQPQEERVRRCIDFHDSRMPAPSSLTGIDSELVLEETAHFVAMCHPQSRGLGSVVVMAKRDVGCFLLLDACERAELMILIRDVASAIERAVSPDGLSVWWDSGAEANQAGMDFLAEIVPRFENIPYTHQHRRDMSLGSREEHVEAVLTYRQQFYRQAASSVPGVAEVSVS
jgi:diadenosine tetraphosphate (Ap4A) HIT family hydrolase